MKKIVVTTDLSDESRQSFPVALSLAKAFSASITVLAVIEDPAQAAFSYALDFPVFPSPYIQKQVVDKIREELSSLCATHFPGVPVKSTLIEAEAPAHTEIIRFAKKEDADLVVMATHGRTGFKHLLIGSVTERVMREAPCPVLVVPSRGA